MAELESMTGVNSALSRKILTMGVWLAPDSVAVPAAFTTGATPTLSALAADYRPLGYLSKDDAATFGVESDVSEVFAHGVATPIRRDITSMTNTLSVTALETNRLTQELSQNTDLSSTAPDATTGEVSFAQPLTLSTRYWRLIAIGRDGGPGTGAFYIIKVVPRAVVSEISEQSWSADEALKYQISFTATPDNTLGYAMRTVIAGGAAKALNSAMDFS